MDVNVAVGVFDDVSGKVPELLIQPELPMLLPDMSIVWLLNVDDGVCANGDSTVLNWALCSVIIKLPPTLPTVFKLPLFKLCPLEPRRFAVDDLLKLQWSICA